LRGGAFCDFDKLPDVAYGMILSRTGRTGIPGGLDVCNPVWPLSTLLFENVCVNLSSLKVFAAMLDVDERDGDGEPRISQDHLS